jgi:hypothetical protein
MKRSLVIAMMLLCARVSPAQTVVQPVPVLPYESIYTPEIHLGSATTPSTITVPPVVEIGNPLPQFVSQAPPASTELLATRHFEYIVSPLQGIAPGSMADTSISLGEYARQLRARKEQAAKAGKPPDAMAKPAK